MAKTNAEVMLQVKGLNCYFGAVQVLRDVSLFVAKGEVLCLLGRNGAGKTTALRSIMGLLRPESGQVLLDGEDLTALPANLVPRRGVGYVPQGRRLFSEMSVRENLEIGLSARKGTASQLPLVLDMFPLLRERLGQAAGTLSGGEQQMLAMARALCLRPKLLLLDEPTEGLMPSMIEKIRETVTTLKAQGVAIILVEQRVDAVLPVADRITFIENGRIRDTVTIAALRENPKLLDHYVGVGH